jgi:oxygen-independent coproporphyrinogen-3 oxidase
MTRNRMTGNLASLYIHVPFCSKKCPYCHFFVLPDSPESQEFFIKSLCKEWHLEAPLLLGKELTSIYFGGGTPSLLSPASLAFLLEEIKKGPIRISPSCEITLEANPEKITPSYMKELAKIGINRISIGIQSFDDELLRILGRTHDSSSSLKAIESTYSAGITNISIDLMYELPHQTIKTWETSLEIASKLPITHLSLYNLVFEPGTVFHKKKKSLSPHLPSEEDSLNMLNLAVKTLENSGFSRYEISAFARNNLISVHNTGYWTARPFLGLGPSAFSYLNGRRYQKTPHLKKWGESIEKNISAEGFSEILSSEKRQKELLAVNLRLFEGVDMALFTKDQPLSLTLTESINNLLKEGFLFQEASILKLTPKGINFYDTVAEELI